MGVEMPGQSGNDSVVTGGNREGQCAENYNI